MKTCHEVLVRQRAGGLGLVFLGLTGAVVLGVVPRLAAADPGAAGTFCLGVVALALVVPSLLMAFSRYDFENAWQWVLGVAAFGALLGVVGLAKGFDMATRGRLDLVAGVGLMCAAASVLIVVCAIGGAFGSLPNWGTEG